MCFIGTKKYIGNKFHIASFSSASSVVGSPGKSRAPYGVHLLITLSQKTALQPSLTANVVALEKKRVQVEHVKRLIDNFVQVFISPQVAAIVHQLLASSLSFYQRMYICTLNKSQVSEALHIAQFFFRIQHQSPYYLTYRRARSKL